MRAKGDVRTVRQAFIGHCIFALHLRASRWSVSVAQMNPVVPNVMEQLMLNPCITAVTLCFLSNRVVLVWSSMGGKCRFFQLLNIRYYYCCYYYRCYYYSCCCCCYYYYFSVGFEHSLKKCKCLEVTPHGLTGRKKKITFHINE